MLKKVAAAPNFSILSTSARQGLARTRKRVLRVSSVLASPPPLHDHQDLSVGLGSVRPSLSTTTAVFVPSEPAPEEKTLTLPTPPEPLSLSALYNALLSKHPVKTKSLTAGLGMMAGDSLAQLAVSPSLDTSRLAVMTGFGLCLVGPVCHVWYQQLDRTVFPSDSESPKAILAKTLLDQFLFSPLFTAVLLLWLAFFRGDLGAGLPGELGATLVETTVAGSAFWVPTHAAGFRWIPSEQRVAYVQATNVVWTAILSLLTHAT